MAINEELTKKIRKALAAVPDVEEKKMFSGITFMVNGKMAISAGNDRIMCRIDPSIHDEVIKKPGVTTVKMKEREYKGYVYVSEEKIADKKQLNYWLKLVLDFNKIAKASGKSKRQK